MSQYRSFSLQEIVSFHAGNMVLFNKDGLIRRYKTPEEIMLDFFELRMDYYTKRRQYLIEVR